MRTPRFNELEDDAIIEYMEQVAVNLDLAQEAMDESASNSKEGIARAQLAQSQILYVLVASQLGE